MTARAGAGSGLVPCGFCSSAATVATVAATASRPTHAVSADPEPMTGQGQSASGLSAWSSTIFRHVRYENLVAGVSGGVLSNLALHPLDLVKIRFAGKRPVRLWASPCGHPEPIDKDAEGGLRPHLPLAYCRRGEN